MPDYLTTRETCRDARACLEWLRDFAALPPHCFAVGTGIVDEALAKLRLRESLALPRGDARPDPFA